MPELPAPTPSELKILRCLWRHGPMTVRKVHDELGASGTTYTTTLKQMQVMHAKGLLERDDSRRAHVFSPVLEEEPTQRAMLDDFMQRVYEGSASQLVMQALGISRPADDNELAEIDRLVSRLRAESTTDEPESQGG